MKSKGILIMAMGHPYYGRMAFNLAVSIKLVDPTMPIALVHAGHALRQLSAQPLDRFFDHMISAPESIFMHHDKETWIKAKTYMYDVSPFDVTIFLDADTLWLNRSPESLFAALNDVEFSIANRGSVDLESMELNPMTINKDSWWCLPEELKHAYQFHSGKYYSLSSEVVYFKRSSALQNYFDWAKDVWEQPLIEPKSFAGSVPDEFAFSVASIMCGVYPHQSPWLPSYWTRENPRVVIGAEELKSFFTYSIGGNVTTARQKEFYNRKARICFQKMDLQHPYQVKDKIMFLEERKTI